MIHATLIISFLAFFADIQEPPRFEAQIIDDNVSIGYGLAIGDIDGDRKPDILLADKKQFVWYRNGDWKRFVMIDNLTESDNVCIAARDIDGDGRVEVAVGAQWNPSETSDTLRSGSVHYLIRPKDPMQMWKAVKLHHEPVIHRMRWVKTSRNKYQLVVLPLHGRGNKGGEGKGVKVFAYEMPPDPRKPWRLRLLDESMHLTHNLDVVPDGTRELVYIGGKEGVKVFTFSGDKWVSPLPGAWLIRGQSFGEVRGGAKNFVAGIQPMHGNELTVYTPAQKAKITFKDGIQWDRTLLTDDMKQGHALAADDLLGSGRLQIVAGWREPDADGKVGIRMYVQEDATQEWRAHWIDDNGMACEDLQVADLNDDGKPDIIAAGRDSRNLKVYWNRN
jgi:hypothetical protein